ncbi:centrosomal protein of 63 kDa-like [Hemitrygon akajei]|uniref:centrosomal protein of 63 kDa-like n=1 Tax=Hemitrygon akajei TaxID=2704970 RepID=UPI003BF9D44B
MEAITNGLEKNGQLPESSCEEELQELLHQIDVMVNRKKIEWEQQSQSLETQLEMRELELVNVHTCLDSKQHEVDELHQQLQDVENSHKLMIQKYEEQFKSLKFDLGQLHSTYEKLQNHQQKKASEKYKMRLLNKISAYGVKGKMPAWTDDWLTCKRRRIRMKGLLVTSGVLQWSVLGPLLFTLDANDLDDGIDTFEARSADDAKKMELKLLDLQTELQSRDDLLQVNHLEQKQLRKELARVRQSVMQKDDVPRPVELDKLEKELKSTLKQLEASSKNETVLQAEVMRLKAELDLLQRHCNQQKDELGRKDEELRRLQNKHVDRNKESNKFRNCICEKEQSDNSELMGIRTEVSNLAKALDQKEITIATVTEKTAHLEKQLSTELEKKDQISVEYWMVVDQLESLKVENKDLKETLQSLEGNRSMIENNQLKELQNAYAASIHKLGSDNKLLQKDLVRLKAEMETSARTSKEKYEAALRHTQYAMAELKEHENRRAKKLQEENEKQMRNMETKLKQTVQHYEEKIKSLQRNCSIQKRFNMSAPHFGSTENREYSPERNLTPTVITADTHCNDMNEPFADVNKSGDSLSTVLTNGSFLPLSPTGVSDTSSVTAHFLEEEEERARVLEKLLNSHIDELKLESKHTLNMHAGTKIDLPDTIYSCCQCTCQDI